MITYRYFKQCPHQTRGSVLIVSLVMLLVLTIASVTALSIVTVQERMARGFEHSELAFHGAESGINLAMNDGSQGFDQPANPVVQAINRAVCDDATITNAFADGLTYDVSNDRKTQVPLNAAVEIRYLGERRNVPGYSLGVGTGGLVAHTWQASSSTTVESSKIGAVHDQGIMVMMAASGRCNYVGIPP